MTKSTAPGHPTNSPARQALLDELRRQGIVDQRVLDAMDHIPRDFFVEAEWQASAWENMALSIAHQQTISQPFVVALMTQALELSGTERVLEVGTGSGYQAAILSLLAQEVITIERIPELAETAAGRLDALGIENVVTIVGDGSAGWEAAAPYDGIIVTAGARSIPTQLLEQLTERDGRMVIPTGPEQDEHLRVLRRHGPDITSTDLGAVRFVPLIVDGRESEQI